MSPGGLLEMQDFRPLLDVLNQKHWGWVHPCVLTNPPGGSDAWESLRTTGFEPVLRLNPPLISTGFGAGILIFIFTRSLRKPYLHWGLGTIEPPPTYTVLLGVKDSPVHRKEKQGRLIISLENWVVIICRSGLGPFWQGSRCLLPHFYQVTSGV